MNRHAGRGGRALLAVASIALALLIAEILLRWLPVVSDDPGLRGLHEVRPGDPWLYGLRPGARLTLEVSGDVVYAVNEDGYRGPRVPVAREPGVSRVLVLGDSVAFGYGVSEAESFPRRLERSLARRSPTEVLNFGVGGYNPYNEAALFEGPGAARRPDLVLLQFCVNDLNDPTLHFDAQTRLRLAAIPAAAYPDPSWRPSSDPGAGAIGHTCRRSLLCQRVEAAWRSLRDPGADPSRLRSALTPGELSPGPVRSWLATQYGRVASRAAAIGARFAIVIFPYRDQVEGAASGRLQAQLAALAREHGFEYVDLLPAFASEAEEGRGPLFLDAWHPTAAGHAVAADAIERRLEALGWVPGAAEPGAQSSGAQAPLASEVRTLRAQRDPGLRAVLGELAPLRYDDGGSPQEDRPGHVRGASALCRSSGRLVIVQDDVHAFAVRDPSGSISALLLPAAEDGHRSFDDARGNKHRKMDLEACVVLPDGRIVALGSGSSAARERLAVVDGAGNVRVREAPDLYGALRATHAFAGSELNVEGAVLVGDVLRLFQRGNGAPRDGRLPVDATADLPLAAFVRWLDGEGAPPLPDRVVQFDLGGTDDVRYGFTDAARLADGRVAFVACAEDSPDALRDGEVLGCRFGVIEDGGVRTTDVVGRDGQKLTLKIEGIAVRPDDPHSFSAVVDMDRPDEPSWLGRLEVSEAGAIVPPG